MLEFFRRHHIPAVPHFHINHAFTRKGVHIMIVTFAPESYVTTYNLVIDSGTPIPIPVTSADGSATFDLSTITPPLSAGEHTAVADACDATGCSTYSAAVTFTIPSPPPPIPAVPVFTIA